MRPSFFGSGFGSGIREPSVIVTEICWVNTSSNSLLGKLVQEGAVNYR
ncbi:MAG: hypothetical protein HFH97_20575 [Lachnospiraceae bacterium]|nr:hypothetical protein [uncultured Acetatifactor sp.]MCI9574958.1 hypothetical protein [Lachnospiraceae bacterium]